MSKTEEELKVFTFCTHKAGETEKDCQDSVHSRLGPGIRKGSDQVVAVADGATQSFFAGPWARLLTGYFADQPEVAFDNWNEWLKEPQRLWRDEVAAWIDRTPGDIFASNNFQERRPAAATFVGLRLRQVEVPGEIPWEALVLGDSCLFHLGAGGRVDCFLRKKAADFNFVTASAESYPRESPHLPTKLTSSRGDDVNSNGQTDAKTGDVFLLTTDAFAKWMLTRQEAEQPVWGAVAHLKEAAQFRKLVDEARTDGVLPLENDDVALAVLHCGRIHADFAGQKYVQTPKATEDTNLGSTLLRLPEESALPPLGPSGPRAPQGKGRLQFAGFFGAVALLGLSLPSDFQLASKWQTTQSECRMFEAYKSVHVRMKELESGIKELSAGFSGIEDNFRRLSDTAEAAKGLQSERGSEKKSSKTEAHNDSSLKSNGP